eukprot:CAMPEP_0176155762 /NCGR_PEP_ID=MMETSP0120_2-20121206/79605_1 /TAXON_ID=160619 /ORGANISM="Kryptoperidinium foliaceum, Strain CCMP 1326" /LENGTH=50 /DNA_ID=CAMNT_0017492943 /DNA_START=83 /DNA_END=231 /DNA_ORIENTATION=-
MARSTGSDATWSVVSCIAAICPVESLEPKTARESPRLDSTTTSSVTSSAV